MNPLCCSRRDLLRRLGGGIGSVAFLDLLSRSGLAATKSPLAPRPQHFPAKAKAVISIFCYGGVSQVDTFDPKPELMKRQGEKMTGVGNVVATMGTPGGVMPSPWRFRKHGQCGMEISELFPHLSAHADDLALIRSMNALSPAHGPAIFQMNTGTILAGAPSVGSWITYGLGTENENLPGYIVFTDNRGGPINGAPNWGNGYMPAAYQGTQFRSSGPPIVDLKPPVERSPEEQARWLKFLRELNERHREKNPEDTGLSARIYSYELAFKMQTSAADAIDINRESEATRRLYGVDEPPTQYFGRQALMARGLIDSTLIVWHSEFGRLPISERMDGRDHNNNGFSVWLAGGGVKGGTIVGATDQYGYRAVENPKTVYDLHATILRLVGLDFEKLTYRFNGRDMRLTDVHGHLIPELLA